MIPWDSKGFQGISKNVNGFEKIVMNLKLFKWIWRDKTIPTDLKDFN